MTEENGRALSNVWHHMMPLGDNGRKLALSPIFYFATPHAKMRVFENFGQAGHVIYQNRVF